MSANFTALAYLVSAILFILSLRGLSSPESSRRGNVMGMLGMAIAIVVTILSPNVLSYEWIIGGILVGGAIGAVIAQRIAMTAMPQLVAAFHSLVGLAAVLVAAAAFYNPEAYGIVDAGGELKVLSRVEMGIGIVVGAITFSGSIVAFTKLQGLVSGNPVVFPGQHM
ncbi:NAD(P)(+) transhydrogenase (Re/Si-specific) subunit beta, partial [Brevundimonas denitrificans]